MLSPCCSRAWAKAWPGKWFAGDSDCTSSLTELSPQKADTLAIAGTCFSATVHRSRHVIHCALPWPALCPAKDSGPCVLSAFAQQADENAQTTGRMMLCHPLQAAVLTTPPARPGDCR